MSDAKTRYCSPCSLAWPDTAAYAKCPGSGGETDIMLGSTLTPMTLSEATALASDLTLSRKRHEGFQRFCEERDQAEINDAAARFRQVLDALPGVPV